MVLHSTGCGRVGRCRHSTLYDGAPSESFGSGGALFLRARNLFATGSTGSVCARDLLIARSSGRGPARRGTARHCAALRCETRHWTALRCATRHCAALHCAAPRGAALRGASSCCRQRPPGPPVARGTSASSPRDRTTLVCPSRSCWLCVCGRRAPRGRGTLRGVLERGPRVIELP